MPTPTEPSSEIDVRLPEAGPTLGAQIETLYRGDYRRFLRVALAICRDPDVAHDAVQEGFARALRSVGDLRRGDALGPWVWRTVVNAARDHRRAGERRRGREVGDEAIDQLPSREAARVDGALRSAVGGLPERQRLVLFLRYYADLDHAAIAAALSISTGTVGATLHAAHRSLRRSLEET